MKEYTQSLCQMQNLHIHCVSGRVVVLVKRWTNFCKKTAVATKTINKPRDKQILFQPTFFNQFEYSAKDPWQLSTFEYIGSLDNYTLNLRRPGGGSLIQIKTSKAYIDKVIINEKW